MVLLRNTEESRHEIEDLDRLLEEEQEGLACEPFLSESQRREERAGQISHAAVLLGQNFYQAAAEVGGLCNRVDLLEQNLRRRMPSEMRMAQRFGESNRIAAYMLGVDRVAETTRMRGIYA